MNAEQRQRLLDLRDRLAGGNGEIIEVREEAGFVGATLRDSGLRRDGGDVEVLILPGGSAHVGQVAVPGGARVSWQEIETAPVAADDNQRVVPDGTARTRIREMSPRELGRGLMRGDRREMKVGYGAENAALAVCDVHEVDDQERLELRAYLIGFSHGLCDISWPVAERVLDSMLGAASSDAPVRVAHQEGYEAGAAEDPRSTYPAR